MNKVLASAVFLFASATGSLAQTSPAAVGAPAPAQVSKRCGVVKSVIGDVRVGAADGPTRSVGSGDVLMSVDRLSTGQDSSAGVVLVDGTRLVLGPSSLLDFKHVQFDAKTHEGSILVALRRGSLRMISGLLGKAHPEAVRVETPTMAIGLRGTDFIVMTDPGSAPR